MNPVSDMATVTYLAPNKFFKELAIFCAAPLDATNLPSIAPNTIIITNEPSISPKPLLTDWAILLSGRPKSKAAIMETIKKVKNTLTLAQVISNTRTTIHKKIINMVIRVGLVINVNPWLLLSLNCPPENQDRHLYLLAVRALHTN